MYFVGEPDAHNHREEICFFPLNIRNLAFEDLIYHDQSICQFILGLPWDDCQYRATGSMAKDVLFQEPGSG
jgi:hypothetical protein